MCYASLTSPWKGERNINRVFAITVGRCIMWNSKVLLEHYFLGFLFVCCCGGFFPFNRETMSSSLSYCRITLPWAPKTNSKVMQCDAIVLYDSTQGNAVSISCINMLSLFKASSKSEAMLYLTALSSQWCWRRFVALLFEVLQDSQYTGIPEWLRIRHNASLDICLVNTENII